jgi:hypothetical protein
MPRYDWVHIVGVATLALTVGAMCIMLLALAQ